MTARCVSSSTCSHRRRRCSLLRPSRRRRRLGRRSGRRSPPLGATEPWPPPSSCCGESSRSPPLPRPQKRRAVSWCTALQRANILCEFSRRDKQNSFPLCLLTGPDRSGGVCLCVFSWRGADEGVVDGADGDAVLLHLGSQAVEEGLDGVFRCCIWSKSKNTGSANIHPLGTTNNLSC